jgi:hypothetical protein
MTASAPIRLEVVDEESALLQAGDLAELMGNWSDSSPGRWLRLKPNTMIEERIVREGLKGRTGGDPPAEWRAGSGGRLRAGVTLSRVRDAYYMPDFGAVIDSRGRVFRSAVAEALYVTPTHAKLPFVEISDSGPILTPPSGCPEYERGTIFIPWGGLHNFGHFTIDALAALAAVAEPGLLTTFPPLVPPLAGWQRELLDLFLGDALQIPVASKVARVGDALFASPMSHYLQSPGDLIRTVRQYTLARLPTASGKARIYFPGAVPPKESCKMRLNWKRY